MRVNEIEQFYMNIGVSRANFTMRRNIGGPFGAVIVKDGQIVSIASNSVLSSHDPTAHAEINAIREACKLLDTYDLSGCELYATGYPCPMCMGAIIWANIKKVYVSGRPIDAEKIGFRDEFMYKFIHDVHEGHVDSSVLDLELMDREPAQELYNQYKKMAKTIY